jgi:hypothetical protein
MFARSQNRMFAIVAIALIFTAAVSFILGLNAAGLVGRLATTSPLASSSSTGSETRYAVNWDANPVAYIPESTAKVRTDARSAGWDQNPVAYIPESTARLAVGLPAADWDSNPVAYVPESTIRLPSDARSAGWDENPVAYIPESTARLAAGWPVTNWDSNPVAYVPESTMDGSAGR